MRANYYVILKSQDIEGVPHVGLWTNDSEFEDLHGITIGTYPENSREYNDLKRYMSDFTHQIVGYLNDTKGGHSSDKQRNLSEYNLLGSTLY